MEILSVTLKQFKIHRDRHFEFQAGVNAICGENGSGKTSILEAIAWVLFDYNSGYKKDELCHQGGSNAQVTVKFVSAADGRTYLVKRQTLRSKSDQYEVFDPQLNLRLDGIQRVEEAQSWLKEHLGIPPQANLAKLFAEVIGIPQGTFTLDFTKTAAERSKVFAPILAVEDYKAAFQAASDLEKYATVQTQSLVTRLEFLAERLSDRAELQTQFETVQQQITQVQSQQASLAETLQQSQQTRETLNRQALQLQQLQRQQETLQLQIDSQNRSLAQQSQWLDQALTAAQRCQEHQAAYQAYQEADQALQQLHQARGERDRLQDQQKQLHIQLHKTEMEADRLQRERDRLDQAQQDLAALQPQIQDQARLEAELSQVQRQQQALDFQRQNQAQLRRSHQQQTEAIAQLQADLDRLQALEPQTQELPALETALETAQGQLARAGAVQRVLTELHPLWAAGNQAHQVQQRQVKKALKVLRDLPLPDNAAPQRSLLEQTLESGLAAHQTDLTALNHWLQTLAQSADETALRRQIAQLQTDRHQRLQAQRQVAALPAQRDRLAQLQTQLQETTTALASLTAQMQDPTALQTQSQQLTQALTQLNNPQGRAQLLQQQLNQAPNWAQQQEQLQTQRQALDRQRATLVDQLEPFARLDAQLHHQDHQRQTHQPGYQQYLQFQNEAQAVPQRRQSLETAQALLADLHDQAQTLGQAHQAASRAFDPQALAEAESQYLALKAQADRLAGELPGLERDRDRLAQTLDQRRHWEQEQQQLHQDLARKQTVQQFISDARRIYKQSGPRITQYYLNEIVREGDRLFRELMNRPNVALNWTEDYEIQIQDGGSNWRNFKTLSGGEQMAAALAIRLALLKVVADVDIAFFDEPTTNMDRQRREQLAEALANLRTFRQLFVISHDDTFEAVTENIIRVDRLD